jgi:hypothetical protein
MSSSRSALVQVGCVLAGFLVTSCGRLGYELTDVALGSGGSSGGSVSRDGGPSDAASAGGSGAGGKSGPGGAGGKSASGGAGGKSASGGVGGMPRGTGGTGASDAATAHDASAGGSDAGSRFPTCTVAKRWALDFNSDPTLYDGDGDGVHDWTLRGGGGFPSAELGGGVWHSMGGVPIDSRPLDDFSTRTLVDVRMRSLSVPASHRGAVFWINVNEGAPEFSAVFVSLVLEPGGGQTLTLFGKSSGATEVPLATFPNLPEAFVDLHLDIDPNGRTVAIWIGGVFQNTYPFPLTGAPNGDRFASLLSWEGTSEFDSLDVRSCAP